MVSHSALYRTSPCICAKIIGEYPVQLAHDIRGDASLSARGRPLLPLTPHLGLCRSTLSRGDTGRRPKLAAAAAAAAAPAPRIPSSTPPAP